MTSRGHSRSHNKHSGCHPRSTSCCCHSTHHLHHNTPHQRSSSHRCSWTHSRGHYRSRPHTAYKPNKKTPFKPSFSSGRTLVKPQDRKHHRVMIDDPQTDYYSSDDTSSDSENDEGHEWGTNHTGNNHHGMHHGLPHDNSSCW